MFVYHAHLYLLITKSTICLVLASINVLDKGLLPLNKDTVALQFYIDFENEDHIRPCRTQSWNQKCCLTNEKESDCNTMTVYGTNNVTIDPEDRTTLVFVYPTLYQYDQVGFCDFVINYRCVRGRRGKVEVNVPFDTRIVNRKKQQYMNAFEVNKRGCDTLDQNSLNDCKPINCDLKYSGEKPFYDLDANKCLRAPVCTSNANKELPDIVYVPQSNICRDLDHPLTLADIYAISTGLGVVTEPPMLKDYWAIEMKSNCSSISQNMLLIKDMMCGKLCPIFNGNTSSYTNCCASAILSILGCIIAVCALILAFVCCIHTTVFFYLKWTNGDLKNCYRDFKEKIGKVKMPKPTPSRVNKDVTNALLREVIVKDLPMEMRSSMVGLCDRIGKEVKWKRRYRINDLGSQISLKDADSDFASTSESSLDTSE